MTDDRAWSDYLSAFHRAQPGITENVLALSTAQAESPYAWLADPLGDISPVLDLACGSGALHRPLGDGRWIGFDLSTAELGQAAHNGAGPLVQADVARLPARAGVAGAVVCSMALMIVEPLDAVLAEVARVLTPGGIFVAMVPVEGPLSGRDRLRYLRLLAALRVSRLEYPNRLALKDPAARLAAHGLRLVGDERRRFRFPLTDGGAAATLVRSLYLPDVARRRIDAAERIASRWRGDLGIPLRRFVCRFDATMIS